ncbi:FAD-dependent pyridine nucleotide-disulfide oxidoreductase [Thermaerobacter marianensis DSM 12885]|uniref:FAD-dependent pyridine nucleotide-disulfide oxidoreductase n=1 Tax=Thermaerobacter marianensis (strain ATCC 700841 / DSM 12885 / JCM 10246 / 7p75a) TaxID=644966 RepID=E6SJG3_THEM7|nr:FAD/NAD(P)-binding oxidoreductase [Thermaerobacter marianensis]ADU52118.1 FAD-dependent pyridine nucleotide-disulfide oxidoreductase [Thermaerobacter marianensis DSM 12885]
MTRRRVVIAGGGWGGIKAALELRARLDPGDEVVLIDPNPVFRLGFRKTWLLVGKTRPGEATRSKHALAARGIRYLQARVTAIQPEERWVAVEPVAGAEQAGTPPRLEWDYLIVALGAQPRPDLVSGFTEVPNAFNLYDPDGALAAGRHLARMEGGRIVVAILGLPYKCPPAPYEAALLVDEFLRHRGHDGARDGGAGGGRPARAPGDLAAFEIAVFTPQPGSLPVAGPAGCQAIESSLALRQIAFHPNRRFVRVEPGALVDAEGRREPFDLLLGVPPHRVPAVAVEAGLAPADGWIAVDPATLRTRFPRVYAIGDCTQIAMANGQPLPKAGVFAEGEAVVAAAAIAAEAAGTPPPAPYRGEGYCFLELGGGLATLVRGEFLAQPAPRVEVASPSRDFLAQKLAFERERLEGWFGPDEPAGG